MVAATTDFQATSVQLLDRQFNDYEREIRIKNYRLCALLAAFFMVAGSSLDLIVYGRQGVVDFFPLRLISCLLMIIIRMILATSAGRDHHRILGLCMSAPLIGSIAWMIYEKQGYASPYYAGLNLVMLGAAILMRWPLLDSILVVIITLCFYLAACFMHGEISQFSIFFNNLYFLFVTGVFTVAGTWFYNSIRLSEFQLRQSLDRSRTKLQETNDRLADSLSQLHLSKTQLEETNSKLELNNQKLRELDEAKSRFFANISHELRTPLTLLIAPVETILNNPQLGTEERQSMLRTVQANSMRLLKLINNLLDLVRLEAGTLHVKLAPLALGEFVHGLGNACNTLARDRRITLKVTCAPEINVVMADAEKLERICLNLLFNALKFTPAGGSVSFSASIEGSNLRLDVRDTGIGIAAEHLQHLFSRFWQADGSSQRRHQGLGIGLAMVKELVEAQKGSVTVESQLGKGTLFTVRLPHEAAAEAASTPRQLVVNEDGEIETADWIADLHRRAEFATSLSASQPRPTEPARPAASGFKKRTGKKPTLLIADDEPEMLNFLRTQLTEDFNVIEAVDGSEAVSKASQYLPEIILCDYMMPYKDGMQVCRELRERTPTRSIPIVLLTARADEKSKIEGLMAGANDFLGKPFSLTELKVRLNNICDAYRSQRELAEQKRRLEATLEQLQETEAALVQNEKLSALGRMSAGLIHEINNPLNFAAQGLHFLRQSIPHLEASMRPDFEETLQDIEMGVNRVVTIIADLRTFTRTDPLNSHEFEVKPLIETVLRFFSHQISDGVTVNVEVPEGLTLLGRHSQLTQVLVNLVQNALDACLEKTYPEGETPCITIRAKAEDGRLKLSLQDNGIGMSGTTREHIFDPFFTTKDVGKGMGLGLSICHRIISDHQGTVTVKSTEGIGTEFVLDLPEAGSYHPDSSEAAPHLNP